ncbi:MAG: histidine phosphatase family protein [Gammaproteobacteria bacterium]|nr:histidine phosphatase family protein [Gammaproteobacteria bacterium]
MPLLTLVRHAKSSWDFPELDDFARPLNRRGLADCDKMRKHLRERLPAPDRVLTSDAARALQTCQVLVEVFALDAGAVRRVHALYLAPAETVLELLDEHAADSADVAVVAHNPGLTDLYNRLLPEPIENLPTFAVARIEVPGGGWSKLPAGAGKLRDYFAPKTV